jgi:hypothetical protein
MLGTSRTGTRRKHSSFICSILHHRPVVFHKRRAFLVTCESVFVHVNVAVAFHESAEAVKQIRDHHHVRFAQLPNVRGRV